MFSAAPTADLTFHFQVRPGLKEELPFDSSLAIWLDLWTSTFWEPLGNSGFSMGLSGFFSSSSPLKTPPPPPANPPPLVTVPFSSAAANSSSLESHREASCGAAGCTGPCGSCGASCGSPAFVRATAPGEATRRYQKKEPAYFGRGGRFCQGMMDACGGGGGRAPVGVLGGWTRVVFLCCFAATYI